MKTLQIKYGDFRIDFDRNYGINKRTGWTFWDKGSCIVELEKHLIKGIIKYLKRRRP